MQGEQLKAAPMAAEPLCRGVPRQRLATRRRSGFTLVELLVVLLIVGMLAAILTPVVMQSLAKARNAAIKAEIDMLHMAIMNYKNEYASFPPCIDTAVGGGSGLVGRHVQRLFPRAAPAALPAGTDINPATAIVGWLSGFTDNPVDPVGLSTGGKRNKLYDFDQARVVGMVYHPSQKPNAPYVYIDKTHYVDGSGAAIAFAATGGPYSAVLVPSGGAFNPETFQILCAGRDEQWGTDDDLSNFWPGTRGEYLESLNK